MRGIPGLLAKAGLALVATWILLANVAVGQQGTEPASFDQNEALRRSQAAIGRTPGDYQFTAADGRRVNLSQYRGKPLVVHFVYTGCYQVCPTTTRVLAGAVKEAQRSLGAGNFQTLTIGFNLPFDTPAAMRAYARQYGVNLPQWDFLSPDAEGVERLTQDFGFSFTQTPNGFDHVLQVTIVDASGAIYRQIYGDSFDLPLLMEPLKSLLTGQPVPATMVSDWIERVRLLCTVYDPSAGKYRINYAVLIEILVGTSIILVGVASLFSEWRKQRKRAADA
jgi:protein SCO1/2